ncbi:hypothetical protein ACMBCN_01960, partial [Candidatus Liberibacter asiaticus]
SKYGDYKIQGEMLEEKSNLGSKTIQRDTQKLTLTTMEKSLLLLLLLFSRFCASSNSKNTITLFSLLS